MIPPRPLPIRPVPLPGPVPIHPHPHPHPLPILPSPIHPGSIHKPGHIVQPLPQIPNIGYPPKPSVIQPVHKPKPTQTQIHHHVHTHIHKDRETPFRPPFKSDTIRPSKTFAPTVVSPSFGGGSNHHKPNKFGSQFPSPTPEILTKPIYRPTNSFYKEDCQCVTSDYCAAYDIVNGHNPRDISFLLSPRNEQSRHAANATLNTSSRVKRKSDISDRRPKVASNQTPKAVSFNPFYK